MAKGKAGDLAARFVAWNNPLTGTPSAPLESVAVVNAYSPSLMPRASAHQGIAAGLSVLAARAVGATTDLVVDKTVGSDAPFVLRMGVRAAIGAAAVAAWRIPQQDSEPPLLENLRGAGRLAAAGAAGGALFDIGQVIQTRFPAGGLVRPLIGAAAGIGPNGIPKPAATGAAVPEHQCERYSPDVRVQLLHLPARCHG